MEKKVKLKLLLITLVVTLVTCAFWTILFFKDKVIGEVVWDINTIFISVLSFYFFIKMFISDCYIDLLKIYVRIVFRVWLLIFITFSMYKGTERIAFLLSISFIFGYLEGLIDIENWLETKVNSKLFFWELPNQFSSNKTLLSVMIVNVIHVSCGIVLWLFFKYY